MFSSGEYSDYCVGGMFMCDHIVTVDEWQQFAKDRREQIQKARNSSLDKYRARTGLNTSEWYKSDEYKEYCKYAEENNAEDLFVKAHNMKRVEYTELWEY
jgi:hypothetical protein